MKKLHPSVWIHYGAGVAIGALFFLMAYYHFELSFILSFCIAFIAGAAFASYKEYRDWKQRHLISWKKWDWIDWVFTVAGSLTIPLIVGITLIF